MPAHAVWDSKLIVAESTALEFLQKRALNIVFSGIEWGTSLTIADAETQYVYTNFDHFSMLCQEIVPVILYVTNLKISCSNGDKNG